MPFEVEQYSRKFFDIPTHSLNEKWVEVYQSMIIHTKGVKPDELLKAKRPNEDRLIQEYRLNNYRPVTKQGINRAIDKLSCIFQETQFKVEISEDLKDYLSDHKFSITGYDSLSYMDYIRKIIIPLHIDDPNAVLVVLPKEQVEANEKLSPDIHIVLSKKIRHFNEDVISWISHEKSMVKRGTKNVLEGEVYWIVTKDGFFKLVQFGAVNKRNFRLEPQIMHNIGELPVIILGGLPVMAKEGGVYYDSFFNSYLPMGDEAITTYSDFSAVKVLSAFPVKEMAAIECDVPECRGRGYLDDDHKDPCHKCYGTGSYIPASPFNVLMRKEANAALGEQPDSRPMLQYHSPDVNILKFMDEAWQTNVKEAEKALNLVFVDEAQSGVAKAIDREEQDSMIKKVADNLYDNIIYNTLWYMEVIRNVDPFKPVITKPTQFRVKSEEELTVELSMMIEKQAPKAFVVEATKDLSSKRFGSDYLAKRKIDILCGYDKLYGYTIDEMLKLSASGAILKNEMRKSVCSINLLNQLLLERGEDWLLDSSLETIYTELDKLFNAVALPEDTLGITPNI